MAGAEDRPSPVEFTAGASVENSDPEVRPEKVARGRQLAQDGGYPPRKVIESVAELLARHLESDSSR